MKISDLEKRVANCMSNEDKKDAESRLNIATSELGPIASYITHDPELNPNARPYGTPEGEVMIYGQMIIQLVALAQIRGIPVEQAIEEGLNNWELADWRKVEAQVSENPDLIKGSWSSPGYNRGIAVIYDSPSFSEDKLNEDTILVSKTANDTVGMLIKKYHVAGLVTNHGGGGAHAAKHALSANIPAVMGTGNATEKIEEGYIITVNGNKREVNIDKRV